MKATIILIQRNSFDALLESGDLQKINEMISHKEKSLINAIETDDIGRIQLLQRQIKKLKNSAG